MPWQDDTVLAKRLEDTPQDHGRRKQSAKPVEFDSNYRFALRSGSDNS